MSRTPMTREEVGLLPYRKWRPDDVAELLRLMDAGTPRRDIASHFGTGVNAITAVLSRIRHGRPAGPQSRQPAKGNKR